MREQRDKILLLTQCICTAHWQVGTTTTIIIVYNNSRMFAVWSSVYIFFHSILYSNNGVLYYNSIFQSFDNTACRPPCLPLSTWKCVQNYLNPYLKVNTYVQNSIIWALHTMSPLYCALVLLTFLPSILFEASAVPFEFIVDYLPFHSIHSTPPRMSFLSLLKKPLGLLSSYYS